MTNSADPAEEELQRIAARAFHMMGTRAEAAWSGADTMAWEGLVELNRRLRRRGEELLAEGDDLSISMLGLMGRLTRADDLTLRQTALAEAMGLSLSRVSRVVDLLEQRGLVERRSCPADARATNITLTPRGGEVTRRAQDKLFTFVKASYFDRLAPDEVATLATIFARLLGDTQAEPGATC